ncbi:MAG: radical SAM protein [Candidatus Aenigmatarchaeota archaeon]
MRKPASIAASKPASTLLKNTKSLCPECLEMLDAKIFENSGKVYIIKKCPKHGIFEDLYFGDYGMYKRFESWAHDGKRIENPAVDKADPVCPKDCGMCKLHASHTALANIVVTNRCDLACWYCFFYAKAMGYVYEPSLEQIREMMRNLRAERPVPPNALQLTGGEPTLHPQILEILEAARDEGFEHVQLNTNGIRIANDAAFARAVRERGVNTLYLSMDGVTAKTNPKNFWEVPKVIENCRQTGMGIVFVPTVINTVNDHEVGAVLKYALKNADVVRGVNYQPVSLVGRITKADVRKYRITIPDVIERISAQTNGMVAKEDFYPVPTVGAITRFVEAVTGKPQYDLSAHFACGAATYLFIGDDGNVVPLPRFVDVEGMLEWLDERADEIKQARFKKLALLKMLPKLGTFIDKGKQPKGLSLASLLFKILAKRDYRALGALHHKSLFVGMMHFMDLWNYDIERVKRCCIHYAQPDGRIVPFCAFNVIPQWYRDGIQEKFSTKIADWERATCKKLQDDLYKRDPALVKNAPQKLE